MTSGTSDLEQYERALTRLTLPSLTTSKPARPLVLALEGPNGAGKTTLCRIMAEQLGAEQCLGTDEAWFAKNFKTRMIRDAAWYASAMFFLSGCFEQMRVVRQHTGPLVIMDRCLWSTFAVHAAEDPRRLETLIRMMTPIAEELPLPNLTLVMEASFATCQKRIARKEGEARALDQLTASAVFHARERLFYRWLSKQVPGFVFLNVDQDPPEEVTRKAIEILRAHQC